MQDKTGELAAAIFFSLKEGVASSPLRAPFGGLEVYKRVGSKQVASFFSYVANDLNVKGAKRIIIKQCPVSYDPQAAKLIWSVAKKLNFTLHQQITSVILVDAKPYEQKIVTAKKQKLQKAMTRFSFCRENLGQIKRIYSFIQACRKERSQTLSMSFQHVKDTIERFQQDFFLFSVKEGEQLAAAAIVIRINSKVLYTFYYAHAKHFDKVSPIVFLIANLYSFAQKKKYRLIDLGTSMIGEGINQPLIHFKKSIGGLPDNKYLIEKELP
jgi:hypothetical protein